MEGYANPYTVAAQSENVRTAFIKKTYLHVAGAIAAFTLLEIIFFQIPAMMSLAETMATSGMGWLLVLAAFMVVSFIADKWARSSTSQGMQYAGLGLYVVAEAIIFLPLLYIANMYATMVPGCEGIITEAAVLTLLMVAGLTVIVFTTKKDFSFMGGFLKIAFFVALGIIVASFVAGTFWEPGLYYHGRSRLYTRLVGLSCVALVWQNFRRVGTKILSLGHSHGNVCAGLFSSLLFVGYSTRIGDCTRRRLYEIYGTRIVKLHGGDERLVGHLVDFV